jgi:hypothetical protein
MGSIEARFSPGAQVLLSLQPTGFFVNKYTQMGNSEALCGYMYNMYNMYNISCACTHVA